MLERKDAVDVLVSPDEDAGDVLERLESLLPCMVNLHIPANARAFQDFEDFRRLKALTARPGTSIVVAAEDATIEKLARLLGFPTAPFGSTSKPPAPATDLVREQLEQSSKVQRRLPILLSIGAALVVLAGAAFAIAPTLVSAQVTIEPKADKLVSDVYLVLVPEGSPAPQELALEGQPIKAIQVTGRTVEAAVEVTGEGVAHGSKLLPDKPATGKVRLSNPNPFPVTVKAQTPVATIRGVRYVTTADVTVPAADPFGSGVLGTAETGVLATSGGASTNLDAREIQTRLDNGVYVINPEPLTGGTDKRVPVVSAEDIKVLREALEVKLKGQLTDALSASVPQGFLLLTDTVKTSGIQVETDHEEGAVAEGFSMKLKASASGLAYRPEDLRQGAMSYMQAQIATRQLGDASPVIRGIKTSDFQLQTADPLPIFKATVEVQYSYQLSEAAANQLKRSLAGKSESEARSLLAGLPYVATARIVRSPAWIPGGLPSSPDKILLNFQEGR